MDLDGCHCSNWPSLPDDVYLRSQYISDFFIALAYFSIPCELIYFVQKSAIFPYRWVIVQFGAFIVLCGATHAINMFTFTPHSRTVAFIMVISKMLTAIVSCATAVTLVTIIPDLLSVKTRELFLKNKADELDREMGLIRTQAEASQHVRMLTHEIRSTLDRDTILNTTLVELGKTLELEECALWMPAENGLELQLCRTFGTAAHSGRATVPTHHPTITNVFKTSRATSIPPSSPVCMTRPRTGKYIPGEVVAIRVPLLHVESFNIGYWPEAGDVAFALLVLMLPSDSARTWHLHERELVEAVADQVAVALSHAAILEQSIRQRDKLMEQNVKLDMARKEAEMALSSRNDFLAVMDQQMRAPMATIITASSQLQQTELNAEQRAMVDTVLNNSNLLCTLINDVLDVSRLEDGSLVLDLCSFSISAIFQEVLKLVNPVASLRKLRLSLSLTADLPEYVLGDDKRFMQVALNVVGNAVKFTKEGNVLVSVRLERPEYLRDAHAPEFWPLQGDRHCFIRVEVQDTGIGISPSDIPMLFNKFIQAGGRRNAGTGLGLAISKRLVNLMDGHIWIESEGLGKGTTVIYIVKLSLPDSNRNEQRVSGLSSQQRVEFTGTPVLVADDNGANRMVTRGLLVRLGCQVTVASSGSECLQILSQVSRGFRIVLLDIYMPEMDGFGTAVRIHEMLTNRSSAKLGAKPPLLVALASGTSDRQLIDKCRNAGMKGLIMKPISYEKLQTALSQLLQKGSYFDIYY